MPVVDGVETSLAHATDVPASNSQTRSVMSSPSPGSLRIDVGSTKDETVAGPDNTVGIADAAAEAEPPKLSKNQQKKLKRKQEWEDGREARKVRRKEKNKERKVRKRMAAAHAEGQDQQVKQQCSQNSSTSLNGVAEMAAGDNHAHTQAILSNDPETHRGSTTIQYSDWKAQKRRHRAIQLPLTIIYDCAFDDLMTDNELISLASQLTRAYSDNRKSKYSAHMVVASFSGKLKERFEGILGGHHEHWKGVSFTEEDFVHASKLAEQSMKISASNSRTKSLLDSQPNPSKINHGLELQDDSTIANVFCNGAEEEGEVVYLTSDSPNTLDHLRPYSTYIIGGIVDKNRHKGVCYKRASDRGIKTAKLPIGDYMRMSSRQVLTTNHVGEIMLKWLECGGDWGRAFDGAIPKRKGGVLKERASEEVEGEEPSEQLTDNE